MGFVWMAVAALPLSAFAVGQSEKELLREAKVDRMHAERIALANTHGGTIKSGELERERGQLVWSFDIVKPNTPGVTEVLLNAKTGRIVSVNKESAAKEAAEAKVEAKEKKH